MDAILRARGDVLSHREANDLIKVMDDSRAGKLSDATQEHIQACLTDLPSEEGYLMHYQLLPNTVFGTIKEIGGGEFRIAFTAEAKHISEYEGARNIHKYHVVGSLVMEGREVVGKDASGKPRFMFHTEPLLKS